MLHADHTYFMEHPTADAQKSASRRPPSAHPGDDLPTADPEVAAKLAADRKSRAAKRVERASTGLEGLQTWLAELIRQGLARAKQQLPEFFDIMAARMAEAQAPGLARRLREWPAIFAAPDDQWASRALEAAGGLQWLLNGAARLDELPVGLRASVRSAIGWPVNEQELLAEPGAETVSDQWRIVGQRADEDHYASSAQRTWLMGETTGRTALCLSVAAAAPASRTHNADLVAGTVIDADLAFYPGTAPLRAAVLARRGLDAPRPFEEPAALANFHEALGRSAALLAGDPWLERSPWLVRECTPQLEHAAATEGASTDNPRETWSLRDRDGATVPLASTFANAWPLLATSGGAPVTIFGEWDGRALLPLSVMAGGRFIALGGNLP